MSAGMDHTIKFWRLDSPSLNKAIQESFTYTAASNKDPYRTILEHFPEFSTRDVHGNYIDCVRWYGGLVLSKSLENKAVLWKPGPLVEPKDKTDFSLVDNVWLPKRMSYVASEDHDMCGVRAEEKAHIFQTLSVPNCDIWFIRFDVDVETHRFALGTATGPSKIYLWDLSLAEKAFNLSPQVLNVRYNSLKVNSNSKVSFSAIRRTQFANNGKTLFACADNGVLVRFDLKEK